MYWQFVGNTAEVATHGMFLRGQHILADNNVFREISNEMIGVHVWDDVAEQVDIKVWNNRGYNCGYGISVGKTGSEFEHISYDIEVIGNQMRIVVNPIRIRNVRGCMVVDNRITATGAAILLEGIDQNTQSTDLTVINNFIRGHGTIGIHCKFFDGARIDKNDIAGFSLSVWGYH
jgi:hypothetical protein